MIIQIIPCTVELYAKFSQDGGYFTQRIICLALIEDEDGCPPYRTIAGCEWCEGEISPVTDSSNFVEYTDKPIP